MDPLMYYDTVTTYSIPETLGFIGCPDGKIKRGEKK
jgi:hypothetical protein